MSNVVYVSKSTLERKKGPLRIAHLPGEANPVIYSVHGAIAEHYKVDPASLRNPTPPLSTTSSPLLRVE